MSNIWEFCCSDKSGHVDLDKCWGYYVYYSEGKAKSIFVNIGGSEVCIDYDLHLHGRLKDIFKRKL